ncbi:MAG TPA: cytochrome P450, partial [Polyangiaceae bacterium]
MKSRELSGIGGVMHFAKSPLDAFLEAKQKYGDLVEWKQLGRHYFLVSDPGLIEAILQTRSGLIKDYFTRGLGALLGRGLLNAEGDEWRKNRKLIAPTFQPRELAMFAETMVACADTLLARFDDGEVRDLHSDALHLTLDVVVRTLFGSAFSRFDDVERALEVASHEYRQLWQTWRILMPDWVPLAARGHIRGARRVLDEILLELIRKKRDVPGDDLLSHLIALQDEEGKGLSDEQLRDEAMTLFLAGHETTALSVTYTFHLLATNPSSYAKLVEEIDRVLAGRAPTHDDVARLAYTTAVVREGLRLYPPVWTMGRDAAPADLEIAGLRIPAGAQPFMSQWVVHHDERWFPDPWSFRPERWLGSECADLPRFAYFPFGGGPRICVGQHFALLELILVLARITQTHRFERLEEDLTLRPVITLRPGGPMHFKVLRRAAPG